MQSAIWFPDKLLPYDEFSLRGLLLDQGTLYIDHFLLSDCALQNSLSFNRLWSTPSINAVTYLRRLPSVILFVSLDCKYIYIPRSLVWLPANDIESRLVISRSRGGLQQ